MAASGPTNQEPGTRVDDVDVPLQVQVQCG